MSRPVDWAFDRLREIGQTGVSSRARLVLLIVADYANYEDGTQAWPSATTIARAAGIHRTTATACLAELEEAGLLIRDGKAKKGVICWRVPCVPKTDTTKDTEPGSPVGDLSVTCRIPSVPDSNTTKTQDHNHTNTNVPEGR
jgi:hypothetical protein